jgi:hypothetical protein
MNKLAIIAIAGAAAIDIERQATYDKDAFYGDGNAGKRGPKETLDAFWHAAHNSKSAKAFHKKAAKQGAYIPSGNKNDKAPTWHNNGGYAQQSNEIEFGQKLAQEYNDDVQDPNAGLSQTTDAAAVAAEDEKKPVPGKTKKAKKSKSKKGKKSKSKGKKKGSKSKGKKKSKSKGKRKGSRKGKKGLKGGKKVKVAKEEPYTGPNGIPVPDKDKQFKLWGDGNGSGSEKQDVFWDMGHMSKTSKQFDDWARYPDLHSGNKRDKVPQLNKNGFFAQSKSNFSNFVGEYSEW